MILEDQTIQEYEKKYLIGRPIDEQIVQLMHDYENGCGMHRFEDCDLYEHGTWKVGRWKDKLAEVKYLLRDYLRIGSPEMNLLIEANK